MNNLNQAQTQAVTNPLGNLLVLAGAGSGKTRVLVHRIAWLLKNYNYSPNNILAVTFTNKAAAEMKQRLSKITNIENNSLWVGTFHSLAHRLLRIHWQKTDLNENFQVIDSDDQLKIIKKIIKKHNIDDEKYEPKKAQHFINRKKDEGLRVNSINYSYNSIDSTMIDIYKYYEQECQKNSVLDFADLLLKCYELFVNNPDLLQHYQVKFKNFLVDEFQDTNTIQYNWLKLLANNSDSVTVVGDDDQSIYGWRGAKVENIHKFKKDFKNASTVRLEQNYRSTNIILTAANTLIDNNSGRLGKTLWTEEKKGELITSYTALNEDDEALFIVREIKSLLLKYKPEDISILYRSNAQSRVIEEALIRANLNYTIYGGLRFFERAEIKDALAYIKLSINNSDNTAFERIINNPPRGIGDKSIDKIKYIANNEQISLWQASINAASGQYDDMISTRVRTQLANFIDIIESITEITSSNSITLAEILTETINLSGLIDYFKNQKGERSQSRVENLEELVNASSDFDNYELDNPIREFLDHISLDFGDKEKKENAIQLMTIHSAKGLEFPVVFIAGLEENLFPNHFANTDHDKLEEERRLCYVGITRAMHKLYISHALKRRLFGREESRRASRFIKEIPSNLLEERGRKVQINYTSNYRYNPTVSNTKSNYNSIPRKPENDPSGMGLGQTVKHPKFGIGTILDKEGSGDKTRISVKFKSGATKWLILSYAKLEPI